MEDQCLNAPLGFHKLGRVIFFSKDNRTNFYRCCRYCPSVITYKITQKESGDLHVDMTQLLKGVEWDPRTDKTEYPVNP